MRRSDKWIVDANGKYCGKLFLTWSWRIITLIEKLTLGFNESLNKWQVLTFPRRGQLQKWTRGVETTLETKKTDLWLIKGFLLRRVTTKWPVPSWLVSSVGRTLQWYRRGHGFKSRTGLNGFLKPYFHYCCCKVHSYTHLLIRSSHMKLIYSQLE